MNEYKDINELPRHLLTEIGHFFETYKILEGKQTYILDIEGRKEAERIIDHQLKTMMKNL